LEVSAESVVAANQHEAGSRRQSATDTIGNPGLGGELANKFVSVSDVEMCLGVCCRLYDIVTCISICLDLSEVEVGSIIANLENPVNSALTV